MNYYPNYPQYSYQPQFQQQYQPQSDERIYVQGRGAAEAYLVAPNGFARLWDSTDQIFYEKWADANGRPYMEIYEYKIYEPPKANANPSTNYITREDFDKLQTRISAIETQLKEDRNVPKSDSDDTGI